MAVTPVNAGHDVQPSPGSQAKLRVRDPFEVGLWDAGLVPIAFAWKERSLRAERAMPIRPVLRWLPPGQFPS